MNDAAPFEFLMMYFTKDRTAPEDRSTNLLMLTLLD